MTILKKVTTAAIALATAGIISSMTAAPASAGLFNVCKKVNIKITNLTGAPVQVFDLDYRDLGSNRLRSEFFLNRFLSHRLTLRVRRNLEGVDNAKIVVRVLYRKMKRNGRWDRTRRWKENSKSAICKRGKTFTIRIR